MPSQESPMSSARSSGTSSTMDAILTHVSQVIPILPQPVYVGRHYLGRAISSEINKSQRGNTTGITLTVTCAKSLGMVRITEASPGPSRSSPGSQSPSSRSSSPNTSAPILPTLNGKLTSKRSSDGVAILSVSQKGRGGSLGVGVTIVHYEKQSLSIHRAHLPTSLIRELLKYGGPEMLPSTCTTTTPSRSNIQRRKKTRSYRRS